MAPSRSGVLRKAIGPLKGRLSRYIDAATGNYVDAPVPDDRDQCQRFADDITELTAKFRTTITTISEKDKQWQDLIMDLGDGEGPVEEAIYDTTALEPTVGYLAILETAKEIVCRLDRRLMETNRKLVIPVTATTAVVVETLPVQDRLDTIKLPKLTLPHFDGDYMEWSYFWNIFSTNVHSRAISGSEKFAYLRGQLHGTALHTIDGIVVNDANYDTAVTLLRDRFERSPGQLVGTLYSQLKRQPVAGPRVADLLTTYDSCEKIFRQLETAGEDTNSNRSLVLDLLSKYPPSVIKDLSCHYQVGTQSTLSDIRSALNKHIKQSEDLADILEDLSPFEGSSSRSVRQRHDGFKHQQERFETKSSDPTGPPRQTSAFAAAASRGNVRQINSKPPNPCYMCNGPHFNDRCDKFPTSAARIQQLRKVGRCSRCLNPTHTEDACRAPRDRISCYFCRAIGQHVSIVCPTQFCGDAARVKSASSDARSVTNNLLSVNEHALLLTASTVACDPTTKSQRNVRVIFDTGSHRSYMTTACANDLHLPTIEHEPLHVAIFGTKRSLLVSSKRVSVGIQQRDGSVRTIDVHTIPTITECPILPGKLPDTDLNEIRSMNFAMADNIDGSNGSIDILIGSDYFWDFLTGTRMTTASGLHIIPSSLGLLLAGRYHEQETDDFRRERATPVLLCLTETFSQAPRELGLIATKSAILPQYPDVDEYWDLEKIGISDNPIIKDDDQALKQFNDTIYFAEGRYHVRWPMKPNATCLPINKELATRRFISTAKRLRGGDLDILQKYQQVIEDQLAKGVIEKVPPASTAADSNNLIHYLPHHPVVKPSSATTKVRIVYDASAKSKDNPSLNECLYRGPVILPDLCAVLIRFRLHNIAIVSDLEKAFLQIALQPTDRDVTRFLFFRDASKPDDTTPENIVEYRFCRVLFGTISSPFLLGGVCQYHLKANDDWVSRLIAHNMYVDNVITGVDTADQATEFYDRAKSVFGMASMNLQEWCSNDSVLNQHIPQHDQVKHKAVKVLGMVWDSERDILTLSDVKLVTPENWTKRTILKAIASVYDPLGLLQPVFVAAKRYLQQLWEDGRPWDDPIKEEDRTSVSEMISDISTCSRIVIPRKICRSDLFGEMSIVAFCDASAVAYACAIYLRIHDRVSGQWTTNLVFSKSRLAPRQRSKVSISLPRLELLGVVIGTRASQFVRDSLQQHASVSIHLFTDSQCVLHWIHSVKPLSVFIENRIQEINACTDITFHYVNTKENPADFSTRGKSTEELQSSLLWWNGPFWLSGPENTWPEQNHEDAASQCEDFNRELRKIPTTFAALAGEDLRAGVTREWQPLGIDETNYSSYRRLIRVTAWALKFIKMTVWDKLNDTTTAAKVGLNRILTSISATKQLDAADIHEAELMWVRHVQDTAYADLRYNVKRGHGKHPLIKQLGLIVDKEDIMRCLGRFEHADLPPDAAGPMLMAKHNYVTDLLVRDVHERLFHSGVGHTLSQLRRQFWIPHGRAVVRRVLTRCVLCRRHKGPHFALPHMPPWPRERLSQSSPFQYTGLDYLGPINVRCGQTTQKMWVCLFTCLAIRAIHLEWVADCSTQQFVQCVTRFVARRGTPEQIISDNAPQFRVTKCAFDNIWADVMHDDAVQSYAATHGILWKFTTELAPWQGGFYERLVGIVKRCYKAAVGRRLLDLGEFVTMTTEIEAVVNSRPITYVYGDLPSGLALRPVDFLTDRPTGMPVTGPGVRLDNLGDAGKQIIRYWKLKQGRLASLWSFWYDEYLLSLRERGQLAHKGRRGTVKTSPHVGDVVIVKDSDTPRGTWKLGRVTAIVPSGDGSIRSVELMLPNRHIIRRSVSHLYPLEVEPATVGDTPNVDDHHPILNNTDPPDNVSFEEDDFDGFSTTEVEEAQQRVAAFRSRRGNEQALQLNVLGGLTDVAMSCFKPL